MITTTITMQTRDGYIMVTETAKKKGAKTNAAIPDIRFISVDTAKVRT